MDAGRGIQFVSEKSSKVELSVFVCNHGLLSSIVEERNIACKYYVSGGGEEGDGDLSMT